MYYRSTRPSVDQLRLPSPCYVGGWTILHLKDFVSILGFRKRYPNVHIFDFTGSLPGLRLCVIPNVSSGLLRFHLHDPCRQLKTRNKQRSKKEMKIKKPKGK